MINLERLSQVIMTVENMDVARAFYGELLGLEQLFDTVVHDGLVRAVGFGISPDVVIELVEIRGEVPDTPASSSPTLAFSVQDLDACKTTLLTNGVEISNEMVVDGSKMLFFKDPDGNSLECVEFGGDFLSVYDKYR